MMRYERAGFPGDRGLWEGGIIFRRDGCPRGWQDTWWDEIQNQSQRDQLSLPYALWSTGQSVHTFPARPLDVVKMHHHAGEGGEPA